MNVAKTPNLLIQILGADAFARKDTTETIGMENVTLSVLQRVNVRDIPQPAMVKMNVESMEKGSFLEDSLHANVTKDIVGATMPACQLNLLFTMDPR